uniref:EF-hand domain-containing protein n=1 Tax=Kalanchoe fedtschenkoi TaxID=63787 RepID=A0A7N0SZ83_KALFE
MSESDIQSPLLSSDTQSPDHIITIHDASASLDPGSPEQLYSPHLHRDGANSSSHPGFDNPFGFLGSGDFCVPGSTTVNPFKNHTERIQGVYEWVKIVICLPIALLRLVLFATCLSVGYVATKLALSGWKDRHNPMPKWRSRVMLITRFCSRFILFSFGYHWIKRKGRPAPREVAPILVSNHVSYIDPIFYFYELFPTIVASESHDSMPFVGTIIRAMQVIYVNRFSPSSRKHAVNEIKRKGGCDRFPRVLLFPEGTTTNGRAIISFQLGAFIPGYPIQPVVVRYPHVHFDQSWGLISLGKLMFRMFTQFHNFMEVEYLPVVYPQENHKEHAIRFAEKTSHAMASALNVVQTGHSYGDLLLLMKASQSNQKNLSNYLVEMAQVESVFHINTLEAMEFLEKFLSMSPDPSGRVHFNGFLKGVKLRPCTLSKKVFEFIDLENNGYIVFKQFLCASAHVMKLPLFRQACELAFTECDTCRSNSMSLQDFRELTRPAIPDMTDEEMSELFNLFDADDDGKVSKDDFILCLRKNPLLISIFSPCLIPNKDILERL